MSPWLVVCPSVAFAEDVAVVSGSLDPAAVTSFGEALSRTGEFRRIDFVDVGVTAPSLAVLSLYDGVSSACRPGRSPTQPRSVTCWRTTWTAAERWW